MNIELLKSVRDHILEEPKRVNMSEWLARSLSESDDPGWIPYLQIVAPSGIPSCRTVGCIGGWATVLGDKDWDYPGNILLGLTGPQASALLHNYKGNTAPGWPHALQSQLASCVPGTPAYARVVADAIDDFIATGGAGAEWGLDTQPLEG